MTEEPTSSQDQPHDSSPADGPGDGSMEAYHAVADKVGGPSLRLGDNVASLVGAVVGLVAGGIAGALLWPQGGYGILIGGVLGTIAGVVLVGFVLMIIGLARR